MAVANWLPTFHWCLPPIPAYFIYDLYNRNRTWRVKIADAIKKIIFLQRKCAYFSILLLQYAMVTYMYAETLPKLFFKLTVQIDVTITTRMLCQYPLYINTRILAKHLVTQLHRTSSCKWPIVNVQPNGLWESIWDTFNEWRSGFETSPVRFRFSVKEEIGLAEI